MTALRRSRHVTAFAHQGAVYLYHDLYGYILEMSPDVLEFLDAFAEPADSDAVASRFAGRFEGASPADFVGTFQQMACLVEPDEDELAGIWPMVAVKSRWTVWERAGDGTMTIYTAWGERSLVRHTLSVEEVEIWDAVDDTQRCNELGDRFGRDRVAALVQRLVHHEVQALKLSLMPMSQYATRRDMRPPYLTSTMPYRPYRPGQPLPPPTIAADGTMNTSAYYGEVGDAEAQFDHQETTLSHLLRLPHPALGGRTYGQALIDGLAARELVPPSGARVLEIGGGLGFLARAASGALAGRGIDHSYRIVELSPALAAAQREACAGLPVEVTEGDVLALEPGDAGFDLILCNEMIGDLPAVRIERSDLSDPDKLGEAGRIIRDHGIDLDDAPEWFYFTVGAAQLIERIARWLAPGGTAVVTEFGELSQYPLLSRHLDHPELSIHFGQLEAVARSLGLGTDYVYVMDLIELDRSREGLATTRSYFRALAGLFADHGLELDKIGYTREMLEELVGDTLELDRIGDLRFDRIEDRLMGLVPHEFKALVLTRPAG